MSQPTRNERRRQQRGGSTPPTRRDPMTAIYVSVGVALVVIVLIFAGLNWRQRARLAAAMATPTPAAGPTSKPIQLTDGVPVGIPFEKTKLPDTIHGGIGAPIDGITCGAMEYATLHVHSHLALFVNGKQLAVPQYIGMAPNASGGCLYWIHTHDASGIIHVEAPQLNAPGGGPYTLGDFFDIWGMPLTRSNVAGFKGPVTAYVNGTLYAGPLRAIPLHAHQQIVLEVGKPVPPPNYIFPPND